MKTVACVPSSPAASATPWAWLPALAATTPRARSSSVSREIRTYAPRTLYDPARCRFSHLSQAGPPSSALSGRDGSSGVVRTTPASSSRAAWTSARPTSSVMPRSCHPVPAEPAATAGGAPAPRGGADHPVAGRPGPPRPRRPARAIRSCWAAEIRRTSTTNAIRGDQAGHRRHQAGRERLLVEAHVRGRTRLAAAAARSAARTAAAPAAPRNRSPIRNTSQAAHHTPAPARAAAPPQAEAQPARRPPGPARRSWRTAPATPAIAHAGLRSAPRRGTRPGSCAPARSRSPRASRAVSRASR